MVDLIRALVQVKTPLTLFAFVSLVFLLAFRTKRVAELFFDIAKAKLTREQFAKLLHRFMLFGFVAFGLVCILAVAGQVLASRIQAEPAGLDDLRGELKNISASEGQAKAAVEAYADGLARFQAHDFPAAIESLQRSITAIPTLAAQTTLALLYQKSGDQKKAKDVATSALALATLRGDSVAQVRLQALATGSTTTNGVGSDPPTLIGDKKPFPEGGKTFEDAKAISTGLYINTHDLPGGDIRYFKMNLKADQTLQIEFRSTDGGGRAEASIYDSNGVLKVSDAVGGRSQVKTISWTTPVDSLLYLSIGGAEWGVAANTVFRISIH